MTFTDEALDRQDDREDPTDDLAREIEGAEIDAAIEAEAWDGEPLPEREDGEPFRVTDDTLADWALERQARAQAEVDRVKAIAAEKRRQLAQWEQDATRGPLHSVEHYKALGVDYYRQLFERNPKLPKTYKLPSGTLSRRACRVSYEVIDATALVEWAAENDPAILSEPKPLVSALKGDGYTLTDGGDIVSATGEVVPGVHAVGGEDVFTAKPTAGES